MKISHTLVKNVSSWFFWNTVNFVDFSVIGVSQGSVATYVRCGGMSAKHCIANFLLSLSVKEFLKSVKVWQSYCTKFGGDPFLEHSVEVRGWWFNVSDVLVITKYTEANEWMNEWMNEWNEHLSQLSWRTRQRSDESSSYPACSRWRRGRTTTNDLSYLLHDVTHSNTSPARRKLNLLQFSTRKSKQPLKQQNFQTSFKVISNDNRADRWFDISDYGSS